MMKPSMVRRIRKELGVSQVELGEMLGATLSCARVLVYRWENGLRGMSRANAQLLERILDEHRAKYPPGKKREGDAA